MAHSQPHERTDEGWPWNCTRCGTTMYHDAPTCRECDRTERAADGPGPDGSGGMIRESVTWMREQTYPAFVGKVGAIAGLELLLTSLWIRILFWGPLALPDALAG